MCQSLNAIGASGIAYRTKYWWADLASYHVRDERVHRSFNHFIKQPVGKNRSVCTANTIAINYLLLSADTTST